MSPGAATNSRPATINDVPTHPTHSTVQEDDTAETILRRVAEGHRPARLTRDQAYRLLEHEGGVGWPGTIVLDEVINRLNDAGWEILPADRS